MLVHGSSTVPALYRAAAKLDEKYVHIMCRFVFLYWRRPILFWVTTALLTKGCAPPLATERRALWTGFLTVKDAGDDAGREYAIIHFCLYTSILKSSSRVAGLFTLVDQALGGRRGR
ncbi:hypothetical protein PoB_006631800 [Plakobranchus ocellatus]|uniref:Uncharacterized protein n=1 Tax=Plakobranchus ocellatus TaxID=259542 RepID=A0AAV4D6M6_9GAST|nr:hypothetical protein PoB_006631800 [Plakobranchus ocellatus]